MRYVLSNAVLTSPGLYRYGLVSVEAARVWIHAGPWQSQVRYLETARHIREVLGVEIRLSRGITRMKPGDEALVVRRNYRPQDPRMKRTQPQWGAEDWEFALLLRVQ